MCVYEEKEIADMKVVVLRSPKVLRGILKIVFRIKDED